MALTQGLHEATICSHSLRNVAGREVVSLMCARDGDDEQFEVLIWMTEKSMGIARHQLKICGFPVDDRDLEELHAQPEMLAGRQITILAEDYKGRMTARVHLLDTPTKQRMKELQTQLRAAKSKDEEDGDLPF
jgi:hypothetical protein